MSSKRSLIVQWTDQGLLDAAQLHKALATSGILPGPGDWRGFIDKLFLVLGGMALAMSVLFFIAYNWGAFDRYAKFGLVQAAIIVSVLAYWRLGADKLSAKVALLASTILLGVLLALYGQTYQTGADPWQLFFNWALLMLPWALVGRFAAIWIVWVLLVNLSITLYFQARVGFLFMAAGSAEQAAWVVFAFNAVVLAAWEILALRYDWLNARWAVRVVAWIAGSVITVLAVTAIVSHRGVSMAPIPVYLLSIGLLYYIYRHRVKDLFMLAAGCLSAIIFVTSLFAEAVLSGGGDAGGFLLLAIIVIAMGAGSAYWLRHVQQEQS